VKYAPGTLSAKGYKNGQLVGRNQGRNHRRARRGFNSHPTVPPSMLDGRGRERGSRGRDRRAGPRGAVAGEYDHFELSVPGKFSASAMVMPSCHEPDVYLRCGPVSRLPRTTAGAGKIFPILGNPASRKPPRHLMTPPGPKPDVHIGFRPVDQRTARGFSAPIVVDGKELAAEVVELCFGSINGSGTNFI